MRCSLKICLLLAYQALTTDSNAGHTWINGHPYTFCVRLQEGSHSLSLPFLEQRGLVTIATYRSAVRQPVYVLFKESNPGLFTLGYVCIECKKYLLIWRGDAKE